MYSTARLEDASGILRFIVSVPRLTRLARLDRRIPSRPPPPQMVGKKDASGEFNAHNEDILVCKAELEERRTKMHDLETAVTELTSSSAYQVRAPNCN
eukprot:1184418-Prorocentrum_minimum.AAC.4